MDASLPEFVLLFVIGLIVLGPERLAQVARKLGQFVGYARRMSRNLQTQLEDELEMKRIKESLPKRVDLREQLGLDDIENDLKSIAEDVEGRKQRAPTPTPLPAAAGSVDDKPPVATDPDDEGTEHNDIDWDEWEREGSDDSDAAEATSAPPPSADTPAEPEPTPAGDRKSGDAGSP